MEDRIQVTADTLLAQITFVEARIKRCGQSDFDSYKSFCDGELAGLDFALSLVASLLKE